MVDNTLFANQLINHYGWQIFETNVKQGLSTGLSTGFPQKE